MRKPLECTATLIEDILIFTISDLSRNWPESGSFRALRLCYPIPPLGVGGPSEIWWLKRFWGEFWRLKDEKARRRRNFVDNCWWYKRQKPSPQEYLDGSELIPYFKKVLGGLRGPKKSPAAGYCTSKFNHNRIIYTAAQLSRSLHLEVEVTIHLLRKQQS